MNPQNPIEEIVSEFRTRFSTGETTVDGVFIPNAESLRRENFLRTKLHALVEKTRADTKQEILKVIEGMKRPIDNKIVRSPEYTTSINILATGYNQALSDLLTTLRMREDPTRHE